MGESLDIKIDADEYDRILAESRKAGTSEAGDMTVIVKPGAMHSGRCAVLVTFTALIGGKPVRVQAVTTGRLFDQAGAAVRAIDGRPQSKARH